MPEAPAAETKVEQRKGREGARWINERPTPSDFAKWAQENIRIAEGLDIEDYLGGIVLIPAVDKRSKYVEGFTPQGMPRIGERPEMVYIPYAKVETRIQYFWDLLELNDEWRGVIEPIETQRPELEMLAEHIEVEADREVGNPASTRDVYKPPTVAAIVHQLPKGFFILPVPSGDAYAYFLCCSYRVAIVKDVGVKEVVIREGRGTKQVALLTKGFNDTLRVDDNAIMKAETGAIGRALGAAGIFTIPGSGIATAEDMLEVTAEPAAAGEPGAGPGAPTETPAPSAPSATPDADEQVLAAAKQIIADLQENFPEAHEGFGKWCHARRPKITALEGLPSPALRGVHTKLLKLRGEAVERQQARGETPGPAKGQGEPQEAASGAETAAEGDAALI